MLSFKTLKPSPILLSKNGEWIDKDSRPYKMQPANGVNGRIRKEHGTVVVCTSIANPAAFAAAPGSQL